MACELWEQTFPLIGPSRWRREGSKMVLGIFQAELTEPWTTCKSTPGADFTQIPFTCPDTPCSSAQGGVLTILVSGGESPNGDTLARFGVSARRAHSYEHVQSLRLRPSRACAAISLWQTLDARGRAPKCQSQHARAMAVARLGPPGQYFACFECIFPGFPGVASFSLPERCFPMSRSLGTRLSLDATNAEPSGSVHLNREGIDVPNHHRDDWSCPTSKTGAWMDEVRYD
jgi:hypothetical protein